MEQQRLHQEERVRRALERAKADPKKKVVLLRPNLLSLIFAEPFIKNDDYLFHLFISVPINGIFFISLSYFFYNNMFLSHALNVSSLCLLIQFLSTAFTLITVSFSVIVF